jgi:hypothetical protein
MTGQVSSWNDSTRRLGGLRRFAVAISVLNLLGHTILGFEQSWVHPVAGIFAAYLTELVLEVVDSRSGRRPRFLASPKEFVDFFLPAHISGLAVAMLLYPNQRIMPIVFAAVIAICSKHLFRVTTEQGARHFLNPSNFGITLILLLFPWVGIAPPYMFTENLKGLGDWLLPAIIVTTGTFVNWRFTHRLPLIAAWLTAFAGQALLRHMLWDTHLASAVAPMTGVAFILFTFYMVTDPATTPERTADQMYFGTGVALVYGALMTLHVVFGLFFALSIVSASRGLVLWLQRSRSVLRQPAAQTAAASAVR